MVDAVRFSKLQFWSTMSSLAVPGLSSPGVKIWLDREDHMLDRQFGRS